MASHDDLVLIINQLIKSMDKMGDSLSVVKSIGEDVKAIAEDVKLIKERLEKIEERVSSSDQLPTKSDVLSIKENLDSELKPLEKVNVMDKRLCKIQESISNLRSMDETPTKYDLLSIKETLDRKLKPMDQIEVIDGKVTRLERSMATISMEAGPPAENLPICFHFTIKGRRVLLTNNATCAERIRPLEHKGLAGIISNIPLREDEVHNIRIQEIMDGGCDYGIAIGVICEIKPEIEGAPNIYRNINGTWAINSWHNATPGKSHTWKDTNIINYDGYPLDTRLLTVGTVLGVQLRCNGDLHFYLNGVDKGVAFKNVPKSVYFFVDMVNYVTKISIVYK